MWMDGGVCSCACVCVRGKTCAEGAGVSGGGSGSYILSQRPAGAYLEPQGQAYFIFPKYKPQTLATHTATKAMSCLEPWFVTIVYNIGSYPVDIIVLLLSSLKADLAKQHRLISRFCNCYSDMSSEI